MNFQQILQQLQTLDVNNPGAWPAWARIGAAVLAAVVLIAFGGFALIKPVYEEVQIAREQEQALRQEFENKQKKVAALDAYREQLAEMERSFGAMLKQLPSKAEVANLLNDISQTRVAAGLEEELFEPQSEIPREFYAAIPNRIVVIGEYHEMGNFVSAIAALPRIVTIEDVEIRPSGGKGPTSATRLRMTATAQTYRYLEDDETTSASAGGGR
ncbi:type IV pilus assembly protein PilO [Fontimonas thermophila]|uniref:Type IV pilus assembly protein PilO n=1 Tax=Fontimonas thermophila TaxID=1076937 RepID=A0A1I2H1M9_9GAMM|nr:type 4a pilus biogenesis protein PilO [Fontimonas thermophila]SFF23582.1 type IV pilus assembly protein PilO [Fontimonas thermophila]